MAVYQKISSKYKRLYGMTLSEMAIHFNISQPSLIKWHKSGFDIVEKSKNLHILRDNPILARLWANLQHRCGNPDDKKYKNYGGKGIKIRMNKNDLIFLWNRDKAHMMKQPSIDRINSNGHYEIKNCRFVEMRENRVRRFKKIND